MTRSARELGARAGDAELTKRDTTNSRALRDATVAALRSAGATLSAPSRSALANHLRLAPDLAELPQHVVAHGLAPFSDATRAVVPATRARPRLLVPGRV